MVRGGLEEMRELLGRFGDDSFVASHPKILSSDTLGCEDAIFQGEFGVESTSNVLRPVGMVGG